MGPSLLLLLLLGQAEEEEETHKTGSLGEDPFLDPAGSASPWELSQQKSIPLIWCAVFLLGLLVAAVVLFAVMAKRKGNRPDICDQFESQRVSGMDPSSVHHIEDSGLAAGLPLHTPYVGLDSPPPFDNATYTIFPLDPPPGKPPSPFSPPLPPKVPSSESVTYATVIFPGGDKSGGASCEPVQDLSNSQTPPS
uniref:Triggering receptor expressed on myeloid cells like 1 n=1 Tax=Sciurus vulgaris TaxID=55149 RepID=A0A8D2JIC3_SCIVU